MRTLFVVFVAVTLVALSPARADVRLPAILGSQMVLQAETDAPFWGWADPGEVVTITPDWPGAMPVTTTTTPEGTWRTTVSTPTAGTGYTVTVAGNNTLTLTNILVGEVWLCSGQSNMEWPMRQVENAPAEIAAADHPELRLFIVKNAVSPMPLDDCGGQWLICTPQSVAGFSGVGYYFGRALQQELGVPVGLIAADWGGTPAEAWTSAAGLAGFPKYTPSLAFIRTLAENPEYLQTEYEQAMAAWEAKYAKAEQLNWTLPGFDDTGWARMDLPATWSTPDLVNFDGAVWFRRDVDIPAGFAGKTLTLGLGPIDDEDITFFNGKGVGTHRGAGHWNTPREYGVDGALVREGRAVVAVSVLDTGGLGGINGEADQMFFVAKGGTESERVSLAGTWRYKIASSIDDIPPRPKLRSINAHTPTSLYNGMIAPIHPLATRGVIWYQGESNRTRGYEYRSLFPAMITDWREKWGSEFPFYFVQIAPYTYGGDTGETAELREAQFMALSLPNTGMAVTMDIGNPRNIHPRNKADVGGRLALWALAQTYGQTGFEHSGPLYAGYERDGNRLRVRFDHASGLTTSSGVARGFEVAGEDRVWKQAGAIIDGDSIILSAYGVLKPIAARYGWDDDGAPNLVNGSGLPASPFRTDDWKRITQP